MYSFHSSPCYSRSVMAQWKFAHHLWWRMRSRHIITHSCRANAHRKTFSHTFIIIIVPTVVMTTTTIIKLTMVMAFAQNRKRDRSEKNVTRINWKVSYRCFSVSCTELQMSAVCLAFLLPHSYVISIIATLTLAIAPLLLATTLALLFHAFPWLLGQLCFSTSTLHFREMSRHLPMFCFVLLAKQSSTRCSSWLAQYTMRLFVQSVSSVTDYTMPPTNYQMTNLSVLLWLVTALLSQCSQLF